MDHEAEVGLVEAHAEGRGRHERLDPVLLEVGLGLEPVGVLRAARVRGDREAALPQEGRGLLGGGDRQRVDDPGARQFVQVLGEPGQPVRGVRQPDHAQPQALPLQGAAQHQRLAGPGTELLGHVGGHPGVGGRGGGEDRHPGGELGEHGAQPTVVGAEVVAPVRDAVRLVDHQEARGGREFGEHLLAEVHGVEAFGTHEEDVGLTALDLVVDRVPLLGVGRVDGARPDAGPLRRLDLVPHEGEQRRDDHGGS